MGIGGLGMWEIVLIFLVVLLLFGAQRLPEIGQSLGKGIREFKSSVRDIEKEINAPPERKESLKEGDSPSSATGNREEEEEEREASEETEPRRLTTDGG